MGARRGENMGGKAKQGYTPQCAAARLPRPEVYHATGILTGSPGYRPSTQDSATQEQKGGA